MKIWERIQGRHLMHLMMFVMIMAAGIFLAPIPTLILLTCGVIDVGRHKKITTALVQEYFTGKGILTWLLSPLNLCADLASHKNTGTFRLEALPTAHRREIELCVAAFIDNGELIKAHIGKGLKNDRRTMLVFKWFNAAQRTELKIPAFEQNYRYIKTIAVSTFGSGEKTSWHFGPQRLTFRVLRSLDPIDNRDVNIAVDDRVHYWSMQPLIIFDDTMFHRSINKHDATRYCLFMDIVRPNHFQFGFDAAIGAMSILARSFKRLFYKNWSFIG
jgi:aspartyl/asparaginyl beta-hydroxylase (cupin superfamily)